MAFKTHLLVVILMLERGIFSQGGVGVGVVVVGDGVGGDGVGDGGIKSPPWW